MARTGTQHIEETREVKRHKELDTMEIPKNDRQDDAGLAECIQHELCLIMSKRLTPYTTRCAAGLLPSERCERSCEASVCVYVRVFFLLFF